MEAIDLRHRATDAQQMAISNPKTFEAPDQDELNNLVEGDFVKICVDRERFWTLITEIKGDVITAEINNDLVFSDEHHLYSEDIVIFEKRHIYSIIY
jgi:hypothetical protein